MHKADKFVGFSRNNVLLGNALTDSELDATEYDELQMDLCLTYADSRNNVLRAHTITPCAAPNGGSDTIKSGTCTSAECYPSDYSY